MDENAVGERIPGSAIRVHRTLGPGLLENVYETCLAHELWKLALDVVVQPTLPVVYDGVKMDLGYRLDMIVGGRVVVENKSIEALLPVHEAQLLSYLRLGGYKLGYVINFNVVLLKQGIRRVVNGL